MKRFFGSVEGFSIAKVLGLAVLAIAAIPFAGCKNQQATIIEPFPDSVDQTTDGWGLRKLDPKDYPDMRLAWLDKTGLVRAMDKSLAFLAKPSSNDFYFGGKRASGKPGDTITHDQIVATLDDVKAMIARGISADQFQQEIVSRYDVYTSVGYNNKGDVWFTAYYTPIYDGSKYQTAEYKYPIYSRPADLVSDPITGDVKGNYPTRQELMASGKLKGLELLWFKKPLEPFMIQVQGSAQVKLTTGETVYVGYAGHNGGQHVGLGTQLVQEGKLDAKHVSLPGVIAYFDAHPDELEAHILKDTRFTFQKIYTAAEIAEWPSGSLGEQVTTGRSIATDKGLFPRASLTFISTDKAVAGGVVPWQGFELDQDSGGGIKMAGRADLYMGIGDAAGEIAGRQFSQGQMYYVFLKPELINKGNYPDLKPVVAPIASGTGMRPVASTPTTPARTTSTPTPTRTSSTVVTPVGSTADEMFPGAVRH